MVILGAVVIYIEHEAGVPFTAEEVKKVNSVFSSLSYDYHIRHYIRIDHKLCL